jgi:hypothetical protein
VPRTHSSFTHWSKQTFRDYDVFTIQFTQHLSKASLQRGIALASLLILMSCSSPTPIPEERPTATTAPSSTVSSPDPTATISVDPANTATQAAPTTEPSRTSVPPTRTLTPAPVEPITQQSPSIVEVQAYLDSAGLGSLGSVVHLLLADISGDGQSDLVAVSDAAPIYIFIWQGSAFAEPQITGSWRAGFNGADGRYVYLKDYTGDRIPEVVNDSWANRTGDDYSIIDWERQISYCPNGSCSVIWDEWIASYADAPTSTGMYYYNSSDNVYINDALDLILERRYFGFSIYWPFNGQHGEPLLTEDLNPIALGWDTTDKHFQDVELIRRYIWNGSDYVFLENEVVTGPKLIDRDAQQQAEGPGGVLAHIRLELDQSSPKFRNDRCQLYIDGQPVSDPFGCKHNFIRIEWEDITGDGEKEILVWSVSGDQSFIWTDLVAEKGCFHQRLLVYTWDGSEADEVGNFVGCVRRRDLFGIRIRDYDEDGKLEILAAVFWPQFLDPDQPDGISQDYLQVNQQVEIYEWDGSRFVPEWTIQN